MPQVTLFVPMHDELESLEPFVRKALAVLSGVTPDFELLIVDDGSRDGSGEIADRLAREIPGVRVVHHPVNLGLGAVYRQAFTCGTKELATAFPADGQFDPAIIGQFMRRFDEADMVLGYIPEFRKNRSLPARAFSWAERTLYKILFGTFPDFQGILMFRRALVDTVPLTSTGRGWMIQLELILRFLKKGYRVVSEPTGLRARMSGASKVMNLRSISSNLRQVFELRWHLWGSNEAAPATSR